MSSGWGIEPWGTGGTSGPLDTSPPTVSNFAPTPPGPISPSDTIAFDVVEDTLLRRVIVIAKFGAGVWEVVHNGAGFGTGYSGTLTVTGGTTHYLVGRTAGWPDASLTLEVHAIDISGNEA